MERACKRCRAELARLLPGVPPSGESAAHLLLCPSCRAWRAEDAAAWATLDALPEPMPAPGFTARVAEAAAAGGRPGLGALLRVAAAAAALAGALAGTWLGSDLVPAPALEQARAPEEAFAEMFGAAPALAVDLPPVEDAVFWRLP